MKLLFLLALVFVSAQAGTVMDPANCTVYPCTIMNDDFDFFDHDLWEHEITMSGGGNWEFQAYVNNRSISYTKDGILYIKPELTEKAKGDGFCSTGEWEMWGMNGRGEVCTGNSFFGCDRVGTADNYINPVMSARLRSLEKFAFKYGTFEMRAKMPRGDWLWPAVWMLPENWPYGLWPASGEIDILEARGNDNFGTDGNEFAGTTLHWGPFWPHNRYDLTTQQYRTADASSFADNFHVWKMVWTASNMVFYLDDVLQLRVDPPTNFWDMGEFAAIGDIDNIWENEGKMAPFTQKFYLILNLAVGGTNGFFSDSIGGNKPWFNNSTTAMKDFLLAKDDWYPTWTGTNGTRTSEAAALQIDWIKVTKTEAD